MTRHTALQGAARRPLRVLIVEDRDDDAVLLLAELERGDFAVSFVRVETADSMRAALARETWDVVLSDFDMPVFNGIGALAVLKESGLDVPLIIVSGTIGEETAVEALRAGASDFILKGRLARLLPAIDREIREAEGRRQRRTAEAALLQTRERMQFALTAAGVGVWEIDPATGAMTWSEVMEKLHGLPVGGFGGTQRLFLDCVHPEDRARVEATIVDTLGNPVGVPLDYRAAWPDGSARWISGLGRTAFDDDGHPLRTAGIALDVTAQRELEEQFRRAQKLEAIGGLAAGIAHDFNNLMTIVSGYCEVLSEHLANDAGALDDLNEIRHAGESATALTRQLLAFSRRQVVQPRVVDLNRRLTDSWNMMRRAVEKNVRIEMRFAEQLPAIRVDPGQLEQVLLNLVINARDAMADGGTVTIETRETWLDESYVRTKVDLRPGPYVVMAVSDNGTGMPPEVQARLFEPFFTTKERGRGTGLGLATVYGIVKQSGAHISVESEVGVGSAFTIYWPVAAGSEAPASSPVTGVPVELHGSETVLVVEDEAQLRTLAERVLRMHGYSVLLAANGDEAERVCRTFRGRIDVVLMDILMPGPSGAEVGEWIAANRPEATTIYVSGYTGHAVDRDAIVPPGAVLLQKPYPIHLLLSTIRGVLR